ncbi:MAG: hypothetical protein IPO07_03035 [Haliscomenobacter sp.]|nr:hypothetical protein [Haliscomenobacter sp.]MBK9487863.1 hypothetical protein [Haliscomenobacter sp.]
MVAWFSKNHSNFSNVRVYGNNQKIWKNKRAVNSKLGWSMGKNAINGGESAHLNVIP